MNALKEAEPWLFANAPAVKLQGGTTGLPNADTSSNESKAMKRRRRLAGLGSYMCNVGYKMKLITFDYK